MCTAPMGEITVRTKILSEEVKESNYHTGVPNIKQAKIKKWLFSNPQKLKPSHHIDEYENVEKNGQIYRPSTLSTGV